MQDLRVAVPSPLAVLRNYHESGNLTGRFNSPGAYCVTFFGQLGKVRIPCVDAGDFVQFGHYGFACEGLAAWALWLKLLRCCGNRSGSKRLIHAVRSDRKLHCSRAISAVPDPYLRKTHHHWSYETGKYREISAIRWPLSAARGHWQTRHSNRGIHNKRVSTCHGLTEVPTA